MHAMLESDELFVRRMYSQPDVDIWLRGRDHFLADRAKHGDHQSGTYRDVKWEINRGPTGALCGYVCDIEVDEETEIRMEKQSHWEFTASLGFDCCHAGDWFGISIGIYRDFDYVLERLHCIIDEYLRRDGPEPPPHVPPSIVRTRTNATQGFLRAMASDHS